MNNSGVLKIDTIVSIFIRIYSFFLLLSSSNAGYSISLALLIVGEIVYYWKYRNFKRIGNISKTILLILGIFFLTLLISAYYHGGPNIHDTWKYIYWALPCIPLFFGYIKDKSELAFFTGSSLALIALSIKGWIQIKSIFMGNMIGNGRITSTFVNPNDFGQIVEFALPIAILACRWSFYKWKSEKKICYKYSLIFQILTIVISVIPFLGAQSRGATLGFCIGGCIVGLFYGIKYWKIFNYRTLIVLLSIICLGFGLYGANIVAKHDVGGQKLSQSVNIDNNLSKTIERMTGLPSRSYDGERILLWKSSYNMWQDYPMLGVGWSNWQYMYQNHYIFDEAKERDLPMPHNNIAYFFSTTGVVGGIGYLIFTIGLFAYIIKEFNKNPESCLLPSFLWAFVSTTIHGQVDSGIVNKYAMHILFGFLGIVVASLSKVKNID